MSMRKRRRAMYKKLPRGIFTLQIPCTQEELEAYLAWVFPPPANKILKIDGLEPAPF